MGAKKETPGERRRNDHPHPPRAGNNGVSGKRSVSPKPSGTPPKNDGKKEAKAAGNAKELDRRIREARAALHDAIRRAGDKPLSQCPEVLKLSRDLDVLIDEAHKNNQK